MERSRSLVRNRMSMACFLSRTSANAILSEMEAEECSIEKFFPSPFCSRSSPSESEGASTSSSSVSVSARAEILPPSPSIRRLSISSASSKGNESRCLISFKAHHSTICGIAIDGDFLYTAAEDAQICAWRRADAKEIDRFSGGASGVKALAISSGSSSSSSSSGGSSSSSIFSAHHDRKIRAWRRLEKKSSSSSSSQKASHKMVCSLPTVRDLVMESVVARSYVRVRRHRKCVWNQHFDAISVLAIGSEFLYSGSWDRSIKVWSLAELKCVESIADAHFDAVNALAFNHRSGLLFSGSADATIRIWHAEEQDSPDEGDEEQEEEQDDDDHFRRRRREHVLLVTLPQKSAVNAIAVGGNWTYAACSDGTVAAQRGPKRGLVAPSEMLRGHSMPVLSVTAIDDVICSGAADRSVRVWRRHRNGRRRHACVAVLQEYHSRLPVKSVALSLDVMGGLLVYGGDMDGWIKVWWVSLDGRKRSSSDTSPSSVLSLI